MCVIDLAYALQACWFNTLTSRIDKLQTRRVLQVFEERNFTSSSAMAIMLRVARAARLP